VPFGEAWRTPVRVIESSGDGLALPGTVVALETERHVDVAAGDTVAAAGALRDRPGRVRGDPYRAVIRDAEVTIVARARGFWFRSGNALRRFVLDRLEPLAHRPPAGLLAGFLVGDTSRLPADAVDDLRSAGLTHYVAVSGSNVALFLAAWWLVVGPFGLDPRIRAATGLVVLGAFVVATRWEPSVVRAAAMAGVMLGGRVVGVLVDPWR
ncbi:MAG: hypothetical protein GWN07_36740, partial [Actinobacteria bacterium]|nr:hypothetical protein [Actinomycetota bacterium]NIS36446.1 hypothetical protein [Actinomycetota bacterium]NIU70955.1 hypothetical protein [Actinomycetota bacterium]NIV58907.1 hypothetical protein [Actinomycetota bacterium]NIV90485.1 hypothetical protein [Actinomycetota bacterium]